MQSISRDMARFAHYVDLPRLLALWCSAQGSYISSALLLLSTYFVALTLLVFAMTSSETYFDTPNAMHDLTFSSTVANFGSNGVSDFYGFQ